MLIFFRKHYPHYSRFYGFFIRFAIRLRLSISMTKRFIKKLLPTREIAEFKYDNVILITRNGKELCSKISTASDNLLTFTECRNAELPECGDNLIVLDNRVCTYNDIIRFICQNSKKGRDFATYLSQAGKIILPKMD